MNHQHRHRRALLVENDRDLVDLICLLLKTMAGWEVICFTEAHRAQDASALLHDKDIALVDLHMEPLDGISLVRAWRTQGPLPCPVVFLSGQRPSASELTLVDGAIQKPFTYQELMDSLLSVIEKWTASQLAGPYLHAPPSTME